MSASHCQLVLDALSDGEWHSTASLYRKCGGMILHSRIADLRRRGHTIEHRHVGGQGADAHEYRLVYVDLATLSVTQGGIGTDTRPFAERSARVGEPTAAVVADEHGQLTLRQIEQDVHRYGHVAAWREPDGQRYLGSGNVGSTSR